MYFLSLFTIDSSDLVAYYDGNKHVQTDVHSIMHFHCHETEQWSEVSVHTCFGKTYEDVSKHFRTGCKWYSFLLLGAVVSLFRESV